MCDNNITNTIKVNNNNNNILNIFKSIQSGLCSFVKDLSDEYSSPNNINLIDSQTLFNGFIESLIADIHSSCYVKGCSNDVLNPSFQLVLESYDENSKYMSLYPRKLSTRPTDSNNCFSRCEVIYYYIPSIQIFYNKELSTLDIKLGFAKNHLSDTNAITSNIKDCNHFYYVTYNIIQNIESDIWESKDKIYDLMNCILLTENNSNLIELLYRIDNQIKICEITQRNLQKKIKLENIIH